jgi:hypothetical protein
MGRLAVGEGNFQWDEGREFSVKNGVGAGMGRGEERLGGGGRVKRSGFSLYLLEDLHSRLKGACSQGCGVVYLWAGH